tara:strand:+ start:2424 stop:2876 length:453 start_codon:yes stop_codon:yes gene_type:complete
MRLKYFGRNRKLKKAVRIANQIFNDDLLYEKIKEHQQFDNTGLTNAEISNIIYNFSLEVRIKGYWWPFGVANASTGSYSLIKVNTGKLRRTNKSIVNTIAHEYVHSVDFWYKKSINSNELLFTHVDNENNGEEDNTAPWAIGSIVKDMVD